ncbi:MAG: hypothetical protein ACRCYU_19940 [Nocardioides sp.]
MITFRDPGPEAYGAASVNKLTPAYVDAEGAGGDVLPCDNSRGSEIAFIVERTGPSGAYADGFELSYVYEDRTYTASSLHDVGICGTNGENPEQIADSCAESGQ